MSGAVSFYNYSGEPNRIAKNLGAAVYTTTTLSQIEPVDDLHARIFIYYHSAIEACNYFVYDGRNYTITGRERLTGGAMSVTGLIDAVSTFDAGVMACPAIAGRNAQKWSMDFSDSRFALKQKKIIDTIDLGSIGEGDAIIFGFVE